jgi:hypothetical protein
MNLLDANTRALARLVSLVLLAGLLGFGCGDTRLWTPQGEADGEPEAIEENEGASIVGAEVSYIADPGEAEALFDDGEAVLRPEAPFKSLHLMVTSSSVELSYMLVGTDGTEGDWQSVELDGVDPQFRQGLILADQPAAEVRLRKAGKIDFARAEFFEQRLADDYSFEAGHSSHVHEADTDEAGTYVEDGEALRTHGQEMREHIPGRWFFPDWVSRIARTQYVPVTNAGPWRGSSGCSDYFTRGAADLSNFLQQNFGGIRAIQGLSCRPINCGNGCTSSQMSVHSTGRAIDIMIPPFTWTKADNGHGNPIAHYLVTNAKELGIQRVIWERSIWDRADAQPSPYGGHPHADHLHVEITPQAAHGISDFPAPEGVDQYRLDLSTTFHGPMIDEGLSVSAADVPAVFNNVGGQLAAELRLTNRSNVELPNVVIGYFIEEPHLQAIDYRIEDDHPHHDGRTWKRNSSDSDPENPARGALGKSGFLKMHKFSPNETKRVVIDLDTAAASIGRADHPDVRFWVKHISGIYGEQVGFFDEPTNGNKFDRNLRSYAELDVIDRDAWHFTGDHRSETLGWHDGGSRDVETIKLNMNYNTLAVRSRGADPYVVSPPHTQIHPWRWDEMVLKLRSHNGPHQMALYWSHEGENFSEDKEVRFDVPHGDSEFHYVVVPVGDHPRWEQGDDAIRKIRLDTHEGVDFGADDSRWYDIQDVYFQSSSARTTSSELLGYVDRQRPDGYTYARVRAVSSDPAGHNDIIEGFELDALTIVPGLQSNLGSQLHATEVVSASAVTNADHALGAPDNSSCADRPDTVAGIKTGGELVLEFDEPFEAGDRLNISQTGYSSINNCEPSGSVMVEVSEDGDNWVAIHDHPVHFNATLNVR